MSKVYKCCYNCDGGMECAVPETRREDNADYYDRCVKINESCRFCGINYAGNQYAKDAFKQRYCKNFEQKEEGYMGKLISKEEAQQMSEKFGVRSYK